MSEKGIELAFSDRVATITIVRERRRNALDNDSLDQMIAALGEIRRRDDIAAVIVTGEGVKAFCAGADLKAAAGYTEREIKHSSYLMLTCYEMLDEFPCATIAAIEGFCLGGGLELALCCDYRIASTEARFGFPEINSGLLPSAGGTFRAPRAIGASRAREMLLFGAQIDARKAEQWGLVSALVPPGGAAAAATSMAAEYAARVDPEVVGILKQIIVSGQGVPTRAANLLCMLSDQAMMHNESYQSGMKNFKK